MTSLTRQDADDELGKIDGGSRVLNHRIDEERPGKIPPKRLLETATPARSAARRSSAVSILPRLRRNTITNSASSASAGIVSTVVPGSDPTRTS